MLREIIKPTEQDYLLRLPKEYLNRNVEILVLLIDGESDNQSIKSDKDILKKTAGIFKNRNIDPLKWQQNIRAEWDDRT